MVTLHEEISQDSRALHHHSPTLQTLQYKTMRIWKQREPIYKITLKTNNTFHISFAYLKIYKLFKVYQSLSCLVAIYFCSWLSWVVYLQGWLYYVDSYMKLLPTNTWKEVISISMILFIIFSIENVHYKCLWNVFEVLVRRMVKTLWSCFYHKCGHNVKISVGICLCFLDPWFGFWFVKRGMSS